MRMMDLFQSPSMITRSSVCPTATYLDSAVPKSRRSNFIIRSRGGDSDSNNDDRNKSKGESLSTDWDKAWSNYRKQGKKNLLSEFNIQKYMEKYVSRDPRPSDYPLSEEVDPLRKSERWALGFWTNSKFTVVGLGVVVGLLIFYITLFSIR
jgi:hypothetical protein